MDVCFVLRLLVGVNVTPIGGTNSGVGDIVPAAARLEFIDITEEGVFDCGGLVGRVGVVRLLCWLAVTAAAIIVLTVAAVDAAVGFGL